MLGKDYVEIPDDAPQVQHLSVKSYSGAAETALGMLATHRSNINSPGISAAVAIDGQLVWAGASGWADIAQDKSMSTRSLFRLGSTSKALNASLLARMVDAGSIDLDTPISDYQIGKLNPAWQDITPRHLASHTAGIPHYNQNDDWRGMVRIISLDIHYENVADSVSLFDSSETLFAPGENFEYSSLGTVLLSAVMQEAANKPYQQLMQTQVLNPLDLQYTLPEPAVELRETQTPDLVTFYWHPDYDERRVAEWREVDLSHRLAGGGFISTSSDLVRLGIGFNSSEFISPRTREQFWTPQALNNGEVNEQNYALGWRVRESDFGKDIGTLFHANHGGVSRGAQSWLMVIPQYNMAVAVNINAKTDDFWEFAKVSYDLVKLFLQYRNKLINEME
jgi:CubicO group peptidase (beta-lactamase class C family)